MADLIVLSRDCLVYMVPSGARMMLHQGTEVSLVQSLGSSHTVNAYGNLFRVDGVDVDALGMKPAPAQVFLYDDDAPLEFKVWGQLKACFDPEIPVNIVDLGLVYSVDIDDSNPEKAQVTVVMTLTAPGCGMGPVIADDAKNKIEALPEVACTTVDVVFDPAWDRSMMSDTAKLELGMF